MRARISRKSRLGEKLAYIAKHMDGLKRFLDDGTIEMDNNVVERAIRPIALNRKNALFAGHDEGGRTWGRIASLIETCKLNAVEPFAYLKATLEAIAEGHPAARIEWTNHRHDANVPALAVSALLSPKLYGRPVNPPQPDMGLKAAFGGGIDWKTSTGEDRYRRGIYTTWRRSNPYPSMVAFDAPNREVCTVRRGTTNTPLQALVTMNDPVYIEAAQALARKMVLSGKSISDQISKGFEICLSRKPDADELKRLIELFDQVKAKYSQDENLAKKMATDPIGPVPSGMNTTVLAALTVTSNVLLNLDEVLMKR